jgi:hypothetical protein
MEAKIMANKLTKALPPVVPEHKESKKEHIVKLWQDGQHDVWKISRASETRPSYVAHVLQEAGVLQGYFDLYTTSANEMNVYSQLFRGILGFKDLANATRSMKWIHRVFCEFREMGDRAGQHHAMQMALTMFNRARYSGKHPEADVFRRWLRTRLYEPAPTKPTPKTVGKLNGNEQTHAV